MTVIHLQPHLIVLLWIKYAKLDDLRPAAKFGKSFSPFHDIVVRTTI